MYQVGSLVYLREDDPVFPTYLDAYKAAIEKSVDDSIYGIWDKATGDLMAIVYGEVLYEPNKHQ